MTKLFETDESDIPKFKKLYKKTSTGAIQVWEVKVVFHKNPPLCKGMDRAEIIYTYGQLDTDKPQVTNDYIHKGKNIGKKNETSILEQAILEAQAKWESQKKKGYVESIKDAENNKVDALIEGGISPQLAHKYKDHREKVIFPCYSQPKLNGHRMIAIINNSKCTLWSRTRKPIKSLDHIQKELENIFKNKNIILDGEAYSHDYKNKFEELSSAIRKDEPHENSEIVEYHIYDLVNDNAFSERLDFLSKNLPKNNKFIKKVETVLLNNHDEIKCYFQKCLDNNYEGSIVRNANASYEFKRSYNLQKVKPVDDAEFDIVGIIEGKGKLRGHVGSFICITPQKNKFKAKMSGDVNKLKEYFENHSLWMGKKLNVEFRGWTNTNKVPNHPVGIYIREKE